MPTVFLFLRGWGQRRIKHPLILPSTSLCDPLVAHPPLPSGSSPLWRGCAQCHHRPRPVPKSLCKCQWEPVLRVDDRGSGGSEAAPALGEAGAAREGQVSPRGPSGLTPSQTLRMWLGIWSLEMAKLLAHGGQERKSWGGKRGY